MIGRVSSDGECAVLGRVQMLRITKCWTIGRSPVEIGARESTHAEALSRRWGSRYFDFRSVCRSPVGSGEKVNMRIEPRRDVLASLRATRLIRFLVGSAPLANCSRRKLRVRESNRSQTFGLTPFGRCDFQGSSSVDVSLLTSVRREKVRVRESNHGRSLPSSRCSEDCALPASISPSGFSTPPYGRRGKVRVRESNPRLSLHKAEG